MSQFVETPTRAFSASGALAIHLRVKTPSSLALAGAADVEIGTVVQAALAASDIISVRMRTAQGTAKMVAAGAIASGATVYGAASGKVNDVANGNLIGIALEASTADNDVIEVMRSADGDSALTVEAHTADDTLTTSESGTLHSNVGAVAAVTLTLPAAVVGLEYFFYVGAAQELRLDPDGTETMSLPSTGVPGAAGKYLTANAAGESVHIACAVAGSWAVYGFTGTWTAEA